MDISLVIPVHGDQSENFDTLISSINSQNYSGPCRIHIVADIIPASLQEQYLSLPPDRYTFHPNKAQTRRYALYNILSILDGLDGEQIIGIVDGDDSLIGSDCLTNIHRAHRAGFPVVWTANRWDLNNLNHSGSLDDSQNVYEHPWVASHFRTFRLSLYQDISRANFLNQNGKVFEKCYDQALMLPIIHRAHQLGFSTKYVPIVHYLYRGRIDHTSEGRRLQLEYEKFIRQRGYVE